MDLYYWAGRVSQEGFLCIELKITLTTEINDKTSSIHGHPGQLASPIQGHMEAIETEY